MTILAGPEAQRNDDAERGGNNDDDDEDEGECPQTSAAVQSKIGTKIRQQLKKRARSVEP